MTTSGAFLLASCTAALLLAGCSRKNVLAPVTPAPTTSDNSYYDLQAGSAVRIVMPLLKSGGFRTNLQVQGANGNTMSFGADDLIGYMTAEYAITGKNGVVRLKFVTGQQTKQRQTVPLSAPPALPFELPRKPAHVRLVYLVRVSQADHNMAIVASKRLNSLNAFTAHLKENPGTCKTADEIFCSWVPAGIAVRPEK